MTKHTNTGARLRPILFSTAMVQAILEGRKTQTRRVVKGEHLRGVTCDATMYSQMATRCPYGQPGDILWVRETFMPITTYSVDGAVKGFAHKADRKEWDDCAKWKPSIFMPFAAARIFLRIKSVRVERLQDITEEDAVAEGVFNTFINTAKHQFYKIRQSINGPESWDANPWVWVVEFERITREEAGV